MLLWILVIVSIAEILLIPYPIFEILRPIVPFKINSAVGS